ncbi:MAG TPA: hypothetical protein ENJ35_11190, partial [Gammaproteobacteria bacterium]|nr:hypothetical protein [Gammaproteobacteria bacterium]
MSEETQQYEDVGFVDDMNKHLEEAFTLADLLAHYRPGYTGSTEFGSTVNNAGHMLCRILSSTRADFRNQREQKRKA